MTAARCVELALERIGRPATVAELAKVAGYTERRVRQVLAVPLGRRGRVRRWSLCRPHAFVLVTR